MRNEGLVKTFQAEGAIAAHRVVAHGTNNYQAKQAAASTDAMLGLSTILDISDTNNGDVLLKGIGEVEYGGTIAKGDPVTADASGLAIKAEPAAGTQMRIVGYAMLDGVSGDIGSVDIQPGIITAASA